MEYRKGNIGRVFSVRFDEGDLFLEELIGLIKKENIRNGWFHIIGGLREADVVTGPREPTMPPKRPSSSEKAMDSSGYLSGSCCS